MSIASQQSVVIVDGYKFSRDFVESIHSLGFNAIHVFSSEEMPFMQSISKYVETDYIATLHYNNNLADLVEQLNQYKIAAVIPATELGVLLADQLAYQLQCPNNGLTHSQARRNKFLMLEAVKQNGIPTPHYIASSNIDKIRSWIQQQQHYPVVIKPTSESGTFGVSVVTNDTQLAQAFSQLNNLGTLLHQKQSNEILAEEFLQGEEFVVNTVSHHGKHYLVDIWRYHKIYTESGLCRYDKTILQASNFENNTALIAYVFSVLDALHIKFGAGHCEVMLTKQGPRLIEIGARVSGISDKKLWDRCLGYNLFDLCVASHLNDAYDFSFLKTKNLKENALVITLANEDSGKITQLPNIDIIKSRPSYYKHAFNYQVGQNISITTSPLDSPGRITLVHKDLTVIMQDYQFLTDYCKEGLKIETIERKVF